MLQNFSQAVYYLSCWVCGISSQILKAVLWKCGKTTVSLFEDRRECSECSGSSEPPDGLASNSRSSPAVFPRYSYFTGASTCYCFSGKQDELTKMILLMIMLYIHTWKRRWDPRIEIGEMLENYTDADISILKVLFDHFLNFLCLCWLQSFAFW